MFYTFSVINNSFVKNEFKNIESRFSNLKSDFTINVGFKILEFQHSDSRILTHPDISHHKCTLVAGMWRADDLLISPLYIISI